MSPRHPRRGIGRFVRGHHRKAGLAPGTVVHTAEVAPEAAVRYHVLDYGEDRLEERELDAPEEAFPFRDTPTVSWLNVDGVHDVGSLLTLGEHYQLHPLVVEDIANPGQRPKVEDYGEYLYLVLRMLTYDEDRLEVVDEQVSLVLGSNHVISFQERPGDVFDPVRARLRTDGSQLRREGADYLAYRLMDSVVDHYFVVLEKLGDRLDDLEAELIEEPDRETLQEIYRMKRELLFVRKSVWPLREVLGGLQRGESELIGESTRTYLRDVYDHTIQAVDTTETFRDILAGMLDTYLSSLSNRMNEVMKLLTIIATIFIPLTFIAGVYGMNFDPGSSPLNMPELGWYWGYPATLLLMLLVAGVMVVYFRRRGWL